VTADVTPPQGHGTERPQARAGGDARAVVRAPERQGLHARPAARVVETARRFRAEVVLEAGTARARAKDLLDVLALAAAGGAEITVVAVGDDAEEAVAALASLFAEMADDR
jgi:phosphotransferase system HPr (HPr) family protein